MKKFSFNELKIESKIFYWVQPKFFTLLFLTLVVA